MDMPFLHLRKQCEVNSTNGKNGYWWNKVPAWVVTLVLVSLGVFGSYSVLQHRVDANSGLIVAMKDEIKEVDNHTRVVERDISSIKARLTAIERTLARIERNMEKK